MTTRKNLPFEEILHLEGDAAEMLEKAAQRVAELKVDGVIDLRIYLGCDSYDECPEVRLSGERPETDKELNTRLKQEEAVKKRMKKTAEERAAKERKEYERLKAKFDPT